VQVKGLTGEVKILRDGEAGPDAADWYAAAGARVSLSTLRTRISGTRSATLRR